MLCPGQELEYLYLAILKSRAELIAMLSLTLPREAGLCLTQAVTRGLEAWHCTDLQPILAAQRLVGFSSNHTGD